MASCAVAIGLRILKLYQKLLHNTPYWNPEGFLDISVMKKNYSEFKTPKNAPKRSILRI